MPKLETHRAKVTRRLEREGWIVIRHGSKHDIYCHSKKSGTVVVPRHNTLSPGVARSIAKAPVGFEGRRRKRELRMSRYAALIDGRTGAYGVSVPDLPGCTAMGATVEEALVNAVDAVRDWIEVTEETREAVPPPRPLEDVRADADVAAALAGGATLTSVPLIRETGRPAKANLSIDAGILAAIDAEAARQKLTRSAFVEMMAKRVLPDLG